MCTKTKCAFMSLDYNTGEKATKKKVICVRWMSVNLTTSALSELIILAKGTRRPPNGYTLVGYVCMYVLHGII